MIDKIALDLGVNRFEEESLLNYKCRIIYSAIACWIKTIALDRPVGYQLKETFGVSRRHIYERSHVILETFLMMFPDIKEWFDLSIENDDPVQLIRKRLINHGDLLNAGFDTNLALSSVRSNQITTKIETVYGKTIEAGIRYSGVASIRQNEVDGLSAARECVTEWMQSYITDISWSHDLPDSCKIQYFNPLSTAKNNYGAWQESLDNLTDKVVLLRTVLNKNSYAYYILKPKENLIHRIDPFLQEQRYHIRIMYALRSQSNNRTLATVTNYKDHIIIRLNAILPLKETVLMESYAWPVRHINDKLEWVMDILVWDYIRPYIEALDIQIKEEEHG